MSNAKSIQKRVNFPLHVSHSLSRSLIHKILVYMKRDDCENGKKRLCSNNEV